MLSFSHSDQSRRGICKPCTMTHSCHASSNTAYKSTVVSKAVSRAQSKLCYFHPTLAFKCLYRCSLSVVYARRHLSLPCTNTPDVPTLMVWLLTIRPLNASRHISYISGFLVICSCPYPTAASPVTLLSNFESNSLHQDQFLASCLLKHSLECL